MPEPPQTWVMTRGSTGNSKVLPATETHLKQIYSCGARAIINFAYKRKKYDVFLGVILNLNFPSSVHTMNMDGKEVTYGYSSGTYARLNPMFDRVSLLPRQEEIDKLGSGIGRKDWEKRFDLVYEMAKDQTVTATMGVTPVILSFARYIKAQIWQSTQRHLETPSTLLHQRTKNPIQIRPHPQKILRRRPHRGNVHCHRRRVWAATRRLPLHNPKL